MPNDKKLMLQNEFGIPMSDDLEGRIGDMCNLSQGVYDRAVVDNIKKLMKNMGWDIDECMDVLEVEEDRREYYRETVMSDLELV